MQWWEKLASLTKEQWTYANAFHQAEERAWQRKQCQRTSRRPPMQKKKPGKQKPCLTLMELARAFRDIAQQVCFHPKQLTYKSLVSCVPASNTKWPSGYKRTANPQKITIIMSDIQRLTLISDPTNKFPKNANNSFKVRLPECLTLPGDQWHASLLSMSVPDEGQTIGVIARSPKVV